MVRKLVLGIALGVSVMTGSPTQAAVDAGDRCKEAKFNAAGKKGLELLKAFGKNVKRSNSTRLSQDVSKAESRFYRGFNKAEIRGGCLRSGDADSVEDKVNALVAGVIAEVSGVTTTSPTTTTTTTLTPSTTATSPPTTTTTLPGECGPCVSDAECPEGWLCNAPQICVLWCECPECDVCAGFCVPEECGECTSDVECPPGTTCNALEICLASCSCPLCAVCAGHCVP